MGHVLRQGAVRHLREVRGDGGAAGEAAVGGVGVELRDAARVRVDGLPAPPSHTDACGERLGPPQKNGLPAPPPKGWRPKRLQVQIQRGLERASKIDIRKRQVRGGAW